MKNIVNYLLQPGKNKELNSKIQCIQMNFENNYKDAAQINLKEYEEILMRLTEQGKLKGSQKAYYEEQLAVYKERMKKFTHKDQKPTWV